MERVGEVTAVRGEYVEITFCRPADCGSCHACQGARDRMQVTVKGTAEVGDLAVVDMPASMVMKASLLAYVVPLVGLLVGLAAGTLLFPAQEAVAGVVGGALGLALALGVVGLTEKKRRNAPEWKPQLMRVLAKAESTAASTGL